MKIEEQGGGGRGGGKGGRRVETEDGVGGAEEREIQ